MFNFTFNFLALLCSGILDKVEKYSCQVIFLWNVESYLDHQYVFAMMRLNSNTLLNYNWMYIWDKYHLVVYVVFFLITFAFKYFFSVLSWNYHFYFDFRHSLRWFLIFFFSVCLYVSIFYCSGILSFFIPDGLVQQGSVILIFNTKRNQLTRVWYLHRFCPCKVLQKVSEIFPVCVTVTITNRMPYTICRCLIL